MIRTAKLEDVGRMVALSAMKRSEYEAHSPVMWRTSARASQVQATHFADLVGKQDWICLVSDVDGTIDGLIMARITSAPPVYDPGGMVLVIDDFVVAAPSMWETVGVALQRAAETKGRDLGAVIAITVCGAHDAPKKRALAQMGSTIASEWYVHAMGTGA